MSSDILLMNGLSTELLEKLSYKSGMGKSLKHNLHYFEKDRLLQELYDYADWLNEQEVFSEIALDYRIKSDDSIALKYERYFPDSQVRKVFNDILGFRAFCDNYDDPLQLSSEGFRVADMTKGKSADDGYRGVHVYFQVDNYHYPIEIQFNTLYDRQMNNWLHDFLYKRDYPPAYGRELRLQYEEGRIRTEKDFKNALKEVM